MVTLDNKYWQELITSIINAIGPDAFIRLAATVMIEPYTDLANELKALADEYTRPTNEEWPDIGKDKDEWKHEAEQAMRLKR